MIADRTSEPLLRVHDLTLQYKTRESVVTATNGVRFDAYRADRLVLLGPSGCGKSSILKSVGGFLAPAQGEIRLNGKAIAGPGPDRMMVFQEFDQLLPWKTVLQNVMFPMVSAARFPKGEIRERALRAIVKVKLSGFADAYPHTLSGGMKQRVAIARALAMEPQILLMDEPFASLDALTRRTMQDELLALWEETRFTMLFVTHSIDEAIVLGSRIVVLSPHPGRVRAELNAHEYDHAHQGAGFADLSARIEAMLFGDHTAAPTLEYTHG